MPRPLSIHTNLGCHGISSLECLIASAETPEHTAIYGVSGPSIATEGYQKDHGFLLICLIYLNEIIN